MEILNYQVSDGQSGIRIDRYLSEMNEELSRSYIQKLLKEQKITVNGSAVKANYKVQEGDEISVAVPDIKEPDILPEDIPLDILYEDDDVLIVNKPKGMVVHPSAGLPQVSKHVLQSLDTCSVVEARHVKTVYMHL